MHKVNKELCLVTTALESTWPLINTNVVFLGAWCKKFIRKEFWSRYKSTTIDYHWNDRSKFNNDFENIQILYEYFLGKFVDYLNTTHSTAYSKNYWRTLIGPWLCSSLYINWDRWSSIKQASCHYTDLFIYSTNKPLSMLTPLDTEDYYEKICSDEWNSLLFENIANYFPITIRTPIVKVPKPTNNNIKKSLSHKLSKISICLRLFRSKALNSFASTFFSILRYFLNQKPEILVSELTVAPIAKFLLEFKSLKIYYSRDYIRHHKRYHHCAYRHNPIEIKDLKNNYFPESFINYLSNTLLFLLPSVYLEGYNDFNKRCLNSNWPHTIKTILTSTAWQQNEHFKFYTAYHSEQGTKLLIAQHGGMYGTERFSFAISHETKIASQFLSWGWHSPKYPNVCRTFPFNFTLRSADYHIDRNNILLVLTSYPRYSYIPGSFPVSSEQIQEYHNDQLRFAELLPDTVRSNLHIYPHSYDDFFVHQQWIEKFPDIRIQPRKDRSILGFTNNYGLIISTCNATSMIETLYFNIPTLLFWNRNHWPISTEAEKYFNELESSGIFHQNPQSATSFLESIDYQYQSWWNSRVTQEARVMFCDFYASTSNLTVESLLQTIEKFS